MKLRIADNSVRLRLGQSEVAQLASTGSLVSRLEFGIGSALEYRLSADAQLTAPSASFADGMLLISVPSGQLEQWSKNDEVAIAAQQDIGRAESLSILIEKDFQCLHREDGPEPDAYPNPLQVN